MSEANEFPRLLYREPGEHEVWGRKVALLEVEDEEALGDALASGWAKRPDGLNEEPDGTESEFSLLDARVGEIVAALPALSHDELSALKGAEERGKSRKSVLTALESALDALAPPA